MRLIDADKLIEAFEEYDQYLWRLPDKENPHKRAKQGQLNWCINKIHEQPTFLNNMKLNTDDALGLKDECDVSEIEKRLFAKG